MASIPAHIASSRGSVELFYQFLNIGFCFLVTTLVLTMIRVHNGP